MKDNKHSCANCEHLNHVPPQRDQPYAETFCLVHHIDFGSKEDLEAENKCPDFERIPDPLISCPFCNDTGFDKIGLKYHLHIYCTEYANLP